MIILDTNVISEFMQKTPNLYVADWANQLSSQSLYTTWINIAEINRGISRLPKGKRQKDLNDNFTAFVNSAFNDRVLAFEQTAAGHYGQLCLQREKQGLNVDPIDLMIAAIAKRYQFKIATRNERDFAHCGVDIINPWTV
jgi:hypothetical protein